MDVWIDIINGIDKVWVTVRDEVWEQFERMWNYLVKHDKAVYIVLLTILMVGFLI